MSHSHTKSDNTGLFVGVAALAAGIGAVSAILFTSQRGADVKKAIQGKLRSLNTKAKQTSEDVNGAIADIEDIALKNKSTIKDKIDKDFSEK